MRLVCNIVSSNCDSIALSPTDLVFTAIIHLGKIIVANFPQGMQENPVKFDVAWNAVSKVVSYVFCWHSKMHCTIGKVIDILRRFRA